MKKNHQKSLHRGEGSAPRAFTSYHIIINHLRTKGEEVKAKNEKQRTRARVRGRRKLSCGDEKQDSSTRFEKKRVSKRKHGSFPQKFPCFNTLVWCLCYLNQTDDRNSQASSYDIVLFEAQTDQQDFYPHRFSHSVFYLWIPFKAYTHISRVFIEWLKGIG